MNDERKKQVVKRFNALQQLQEQQVPQWKQITKFILPDRGFYCGDDPTKARVPDYKAIIDDTGTNASEIVSAGLLSGLTPQNKQWFRFGLKSNPELARNHNVKLWLSDTEQRIMSVLNYSNVYEALPIIYEECAGFGTAASAVLDDFETIIRMRTYTAGEYMIGVNNKGEVDTFARVTQMTTAQIVEQFGLDNVPSEVQAAYKGGSLDKFFTVFNLVQPNYDRVEGLYDKRNKRFASFYWMNCGSDKEFLDMRGFDDFPFLTPRWKISTTNSCYGVGRGTKCLGNIKTLQKLQKDSLLGVEMGIKPPMQVNSANRVNGISIMPGYLNFVSAAGASYGMKTAFDVQLDLQSVEAKIATTRQLIMTGYGASLFLMLANNDKAKTAREVAAIESEQLIQLGPTLQIMTGEGTTPLLNLTFNKMLFGGMLAPVPRELEGVDIDIEYIGLLAQAQKIAELNVIGQSLTFAGQVMAINAESGDIVNWDSAIKTYFDKAGAPPELLNSDAAVEQVRKARAEAAAQEKQLAQAQILAQGAKTLSETDMSKQNALTAIVGGGEGAA
jgi:hypothetical protein